MTQELSQRLHFLPDFDHQGLVGKILEVVFMTNYYIPKNYQTLFKICLQRVGKFDIFVDFPKSPHSSKIDDSATFGVVQQQSEIERET